MLISKFKKDGDVINIHDLQELIGLKLPSDYAVFLQKYNGGDTPETNWTGKGKSDIQGFFGYKVADKNYDIENILNYIIVQDLIEKNKFPIAKNCFGDYFCLDCIDGGVWFIYHDSPKSIKSASDFISFISGCKSKKIGHIRTIEERTKRRFEVTGTLPDDKIIAAWQKEIDFYSNIHQEEVVL